MATLALIAACTGCGGASMSSLFPERPSLASRCRVGATQTSVLVTEWAAAEKANLEALLDGGGVAVAFSGCSLRIVPECRIAGNYSWRQTTPASETITIEDEAELYAKLPLGAVSLEGELQRAGSLFMTTTVDGQWRLEGKSGADIPNHPACAGATHLVTALSLGSFALNRGNSARMHAAADVHAVASVGGGYQQQASLVRAAGNPTTCGTGTSEAPAPGCASPIQAFLSPIPGRAPEPGPPGTVEVDFVSSNEVRWDVYVDDEATCTTPCSEWVDPNHPVQLRTRETAPQTLMVKGLHRQSGPLQVAARPRDNAKLATGITFTALGGIATLTGITLTSLGCGIGDGGMCSAGLITMAAGGAVTAGSILLIVDSSAEYGVRPLFAPDGFGLTVAGPLDPSKL